MSLTADRSDELTGLAQMSRAKGVQPLDPYGRFLKLSDVMESIGVSQAMVYKLMHDQRLPFPQPIKIGRVSVWIERDVVRWKALVAGDLRIPSLPG